MNNNINVSHSNGVTIVYTEGVHTEQPVMIDPENNRRWRNIAWAVVGATILEVIALDERAKLLITTVITVILTLWLAYKLTDAVVASHRRRQWTLAQIAGRADMQHAALMRGDMDTALFGIYPVQKVNTP